MKVFSAETPTAIDPSTRKGQATFKCHQRVIRERAEISDVGLFERRNHLESLSGATVKEISFTSAAPIILEHEWLGNMPLPKSVRKIHGLFLNGDLGGCVVYVEPSTRAFNANWPRKVLQLNRGACVWWTPKNAASMLIGSSLRLLSKEGFVCVVAYCTPEAGEYGTIYQACNFWYVGQTQPSTMYQLDGRWVSERTLADKKAWAKTKHVRWQHAFDNLPSKPILPKFKYVKLIGSKSQNLQMSKEFSWSPLPYPKRDACPRGELASTESGFLL